MYGHNSLCSYILKFIEYIRIKSVSLIVAPLISSRQHELPLAWVLLRQHIKTEILNSFSLSFSGSPAFPQFKVYFRLYPFPHSLVFLDNVHVIRKINSDGRCLCRDGYSAEQRRSVEGHIPPLPMLILWG